MPSEPIAVETSAGPSPTVRTIVSFLLFIHLFALGVMSLSKASRAPLELRLREVPGLLPYSQLLGFDWPYTHNLTGQIHTGAPDNDLRLVVDLRLADGSTEQVIWPERTQFPSDRWRRYATLVSEGAQLADGTVFEDKIPGAIAKRLVAERRATGGEIRFEGRTLPPEIFQTVPDEYAPIGRPWKILVSGGNVSLFKVESAADTAPSAAPSLPPAQPQ